MVETKDNVLEIFLAISKRWPPEQRRKYLEKIRQDAIDRLEEED